MTDWAQLGVWLLASLILAATIVNPSLLAAALFLAVFGGLILVWRWL